MHRCRRVKIIEIKSYQGDRGSWFNTLTMTNSAGFLLSLTNKCVKPICVSIFVLTFHRILSSSPSQSPGWRKPWFMFSVLINCAVAHCCPSWLSSPTSTFHFLPPAFPILLFPVFFSFSWEYAFNVMFPFSLFFFCLCAWGLLSLPHPVSFSFFQIRSRWELVLENYVLLASLYGSCEFFLNLCVWLVVLCVSCHISAVILLP